MKHRVAILALVALAALQAGALSSSAAGDNGVVFLKVCQRVNCKDCVTNTAATYDCHEGSLSDPNATGVSFQTICPHDGSYVTVLSYSESKCKGKRTFAQHDTNKCSAAGHVYTCQAPKTNLYVSGECSTHLCLHGLGTCINSYTPVGRCVPSSYTNRRSTFIESCGANAAVMHTFTESNTCEGKYSTSNQSTYECEGNGFGQYDTYTCTSIPPKPVPNHYPHVKRAVCHSTNIQCEKDCTLSAPIPTGKCHARGDFGMVYWCTDTRLYEISYMDSKCSPSTENGVNAQDRGVCSQDGAAGTWSTTHCLKGSAGEVGQPLDASLARLIDDYEAKKRTPTSPKDINDHQL